MNGLRNASFNLQRTLNDSLQAPTGLLDLAHNLALIRVNLPGAVPVTRSAVSASPGADRLAEIRALGRHCVVRVPVEAAAVSLLPAHHSIEAMRHWVANSAPQLQVRVGQFVNRSPDRAPAMRQPNAASGVGEVRSLTRIRRAMRARAAVVMFLCVSALGQLRAEERPASPEKVNVFPHPRSHSPQRELRPDYGALLRKGQQYHWRETPPQIFRLLEMHKEAARRARARRELLESEPPG